MRGADHLREIDHNRHTGVSTDKDIEFVVISVDESSLGETDDDVHER